MSGARRATPTRRELIRAGATGAVGLAGGTGALLLPAVAQAAGANPPDAAPVSETERLQRLVQLELLLLFCYRYVIDSPVLTSRARATVTPFLAHEQAHIAALEHRLTARGGVIPPGPPTVQAANHDLAHRKVAGRLGQLKGDLDAVRLLLTLEQVTIGAYFVALLTIQDPELIVLVSQIMANEAQHDAMLGLRLPPNKPRNAVPYGLVQGLQ